MNKLSFDIAYFDESGWFLPSYERHLQGWMRQVGDKRGGRLLYQGHKYRLAMQHVKNRRLAVDVGAHVGLWSWQMAQDFEHVIAFEPMPVHAQCWRRNMKGFENVQLREMALGPQPGNVWLKTRTKDSSGDTNVSPDGPTGEGDHQAVCSTLTQQLWNEPTVDFIKIDCEGFEQFIVQGGESVIQKNKPTMIVEQKPETGMEDRYGVKTTGAIDLLKSWGAKVKAAKQGDYVVGW